MKRKELKSPGLFESLLEIQVEKGRYVDLHNDYDCYQINYLSKTGELQLLFKALDATIEQVELVFEGAVINSMSFSFEDVSEMATIDSLYRGKYQDLSGLRELSEEGKSYYYVEFYRGAAFELFASKVILVYN